MIPVHTTCNYPNPFHPTPRDYSHPVSKIYGRDAGFQTLCIHNPPPESRCDDSATFVTFLLPHLDAVNDHLAIIFPCWIPLISCIPEILLCGRGLINPRLARLTVLEPAVCTPNRNIQNQVEVFVKRSSRIPSLTPRVNKPSPVRVRQRKVSTGVQRRIEIEVENLQKTSVNVGENVLLTPLHTKGVRSSSISGV